MTHRRSNGRRGAPVHWMGALLAICLSQPALADTPVSLLPKNLSPWGMFMSADIVVKAVMIGLVFASLVTWTVWLSKTIELMTAGRLVQRRLKMLEQGGSLADALRTSGNDRDAVAQLIRSTAQEVSLSGGVVDDGLKERVALRLERAEAASARQIASGTGVLATIGATAPFVGLFGTVWGIMNAFIGISQAHTTNLAVVAPGIAEALLTTAIGLFAAIPAVVIYNHLARVTTGYRARLTDASAQLLLMISRRHLGDISASSPSRSD